MDIEGTKSLRQICWHQGLFLQPQHLQHMDLFHQSRMSTLMKIGHPFFYGVAMLEINEGALSNDVFEVINGEFLMKDGSFVDYPDEAILPARSFSADWKDRHKPFSIYVGIRKMNPKGGNVTMVSEQNPDSNVDTRFLSSAKAESVADYHMDGPPASIKQLSHVMKLFWQNEIDDAEDYELMQIAEVVSDGGATILSPTYIPPSVHIGSSPVMLRALKEIRDELSSRIRQLEDYKLPAGTSGTAVDSRSISFLMAIQILSQYVPMLFHYIGAPTLHPFFAYGVLRQLIGGVSTLSTRVSFLGETDQGEKLLPEYAHENLGECIQSAYKLIVQLMNELTVSSETIIRFEKQQANQFYATLPEGAAQAKNIYISLITKQNIEDILDSFLNRAKIGSEDQVKIYAERSLPGLSLVFLKSQPEGVPRRPNSSYFLVDKRHFAWKGVVEKNNIMLSWDGAPEDLKVDIIAV